MNVNWRQTDKQKITVGPLLTDKTRLFSTYTYTTSSEILTFFYKVDTCAKHSFFKNWCFQLIHRKMNRVLFFVERMLFKDLPRFQTKHFGRCKEISFSKTCFCSRMFACFTVISFLYHKSCMLLYFLNYTNQQNLLYGQTLSTCDMDSCPTWKRNDLKLTTQLLNEEFHLNTTDKQNISGVPSLTKKASFLSLWTA